VWWGAGRGRAPTPATRKVPQTLILGGRGQDMLFPKWSNRLPLLIGVGSTILSIAVIVLFAYYISPYSTQVGYSPKQPVPYSHKLHAGDLGMDCR
jgi:hypothetical protein